MDIFRWRGARLWLAGLALACSAFAFAACGGDDAVDELSRQQELREERRQGAQEERLRQLERQLREERQKRERKKGGSKPERPTPDPPPAAPPVSPPVSPSTSSCGDGLSVGPNTTCEFARSVRDEYFASGGGSVTVQAYSPVTQLSYTMSCTAGAPTTCTGGNNASVFISN